jgi:hypothetical protein
MKREFCSDVTGKQILIDTISRTVSAETARRIVDEIYTAGYVCVPKEPTEKMVMGAYYYALDEDAAGVWRSMIAVSDGTATDEDINGLKGAGSP